MSSVAGTRLVMSRTCASSPTSRGLCNRPPSWSVACDDSVMAARELVQLFYEKFWNEVDLGIADEILHPDVTFRGSVGLGATGRREVCDYVLMVTTALSGYRCDVESLIADGERVAAKVRFSGNHTGEFLGYAPTGRRVEWVGAAFFSVERDKLRDVWVLGDLESLRAQLGSVV